MEIEVKGHSGCSIDIVREGKNFLSINVLKTLNT